MENILDLDKKHVWHPFTQHQSSGDPLVIKKAKGSLLYDDQGNSYIDSNASWWVNVHGHGHEYIGNAINEQFEKIDHIVFAGVTHPKAVELAKRITEILPSNFEKVFFSDNGSTAVEIALKMAFQFWYNKGEEKKRVLALNGAYHGDTFGAMSVGQRGYFNKPFESFFFEVDYLEFPTKENEQALLDKAEKYFKTGDFAAMIIEPLVQGASGMQMYTSEFLDKLSKLARKNNVLIIFDEVMTGFGRTGKMFSMDHCAIKPDLTCLSKGLTAGVMALGLTVATKEIFEAFLAEDTSKALLHGHSFTANPIACAVACANLDLFEKENTLNKLEIISEWNKLFSSELAKLDLVKNIRQTGTILAFEVQDKESGYFSDIRSKAYNYFLENGVLNRPLGNTIFINPPYCITKVEFDKVTSTILSFLESQKK